IQAGYNVFVATGCSACHGQNAEGSIGWVLNNPFYNGKFHLHKGTPLQELLEGVHEVPEEVMTLWNRCQEVRHEKALSP
ncbi:MAG: hypothetical protein O2783_05190, partial [Chloroflexi bacterium]|nr:hypothetical protein [Chloroflexota bacterium]